jgi:hypothetical protein
VILLWFGPGCDAQFFKHRTRIDGLISCRLEMGTSESNYENSSLLCFWAMVIIFKPRSNSIGHHGVVFFECGRVRLEIVTFLLKPKKWSQTLFGY